jgi:hypothetical protein
MPISALISAIALAFVVIYSPLHEAKAFGLRLGPLFLGLPTPGFHRHHRVARTEAESAVLQNDRPTLLCPILAWTSLDDGIFSAHSAASLQFGYESIFAQAFAKYPPERATDLCPYRETSADIMRRIERETAPTAAQRLLLDKLATALGQANGYLIKSCPPEIPAAPVARLQLMEGQIDALIMALEIIRPPLQKSEQSLDDKQRAQLDGDGPPVGGAFFGIAAKPGARTGRLRWSSRPCTRPTPASGDCQRRRRIQPGCAWIGRRVSGRRATNCLREVRRHRSRLDATWRVVQSIQVALANFQKDLSDQQNTQFNSLEIASTR